jgi:hypothetical protein
LEYCAALINTLDNVGNSEALFQSVSRRVVLGNTRGVIMPCLDQLRRAAEAGHEESMYALSLFLYRPNSGEAEDDEGPKWRTRERGSEWEPIKFYSRIRPMNPISLMHLRNLLFPSSRSY